MQNCKLHFFSGLAMQLKEAIGPKYIMKRQSKLTEFAFEKLKKSKNIVLLGNKHLPHLPTYSMVIKNAISGLFVGPLVCPIWLPLFIFFTVKASLTVHLVSGARIRTQDLSVASSLLTTRPWLLTLRSFICYIGLIDTPSVLSRWMGFKTGSPL